MLLSAPPQILINYSKIYPVFTTSDLQMNYYKNRKASDNKIYHQYSESEIDKKKHVPEKVTFELKP